MSSFFDSIKQGLNEAVEYERGEIHGVKVKKITVAPIHSYTASEIKAIRLKQSMTQRLFAEALGVSVKTVESWETGTNRPSGIANRMFEILTQDNDLFIRYAIVAKS